MSLLKRKVKKALCGMMTASLCAGLLYIYNFNSSSHADVYAANDNLAISATVSVPDCMKDAVKSLWQVNDGNSNTETARITDSTVTDKYVGNDYFQFDWDNAVDVNKVVLSSWYCSGQAPVSWKVSVYDEVNKSWKEVGLVENAGWTDKNDIQSKSVLFATQKNIKSLRLQIIDNNNSWLKYVIKEIEIYNDTDLVYGDATGDKWLDLRDYVRLKKYVNHKRLDISTESTDLNGDSSVDISDCNALGDYLIGRESMVPYKKGYVLDWSEEFDGTELDTNKWLGAYFPHSTYPGRAQATYKVVNGSLNLILDENSTSFNQTGINGMIPSSLQTFEKDYLHPVSDQVTSVNKFNGYATKYGYFEMRCKAPSCGGGGAYAWWLTGIEDDEVITLQPDGTETQTTTHNLEVDVIENLFSNPGLWRANVIPWNDAKVSAVLKRDNYTHIREQIDGDYINEWHTYAFDWTPDHMDFYLDGKLYRRINSAPDYEMCMYLSMYMVRVPESVPNYTWGYANDVFPKTWEIDYIRVFKKAE